MRLLIPLFFILVGTIVGALVGKVLSSSSTDYKVSVLAGGVGAFVGLLAKDFLDIAPGSGLGGTLLAAMAGAALCAAITSLFVK